MPCSSTKVSATWGGKNPCRAGDQQAGKQLDRKGPEGPGGHQVEHEQAMRPCHKEGC